MFALMASLNLLASVTLFKVPAVSARERSGGSPSHETSHRGGLGEILDALRYLRAQRILMWMLVIHGFSSMLGLPYQRLLPGFVDVVLSSNEDETAVRMGLLLTMTAIGALAGSLLIASLPSRRRGQLLIASLTVFGITLIGFSASEVLWLSAAIVLVLGVGQAGRQSLVNILIQSHVSDQYRGRISSIMLLEDGIESAGIFAISLLAEAFGPQVALGGVGVAMLALSGTLWLTRTIRQLQ